MNKSYTNKYKKNVAFSYSYKLVCVDDNFIEPFQSYLAEGVVYNCISNMIEESKYCSNAMKKYFNKEQVMTKKDNEDFDNSIKCWICENTYVDRDVKIRDQCHVNEKYRGSAHRDCNINVKLNHKIPVVFHNLNPYYARTRRIQF